LPAFFGLLNSSDTQNTFPSSIYLYENFFDVLGNFIAFTPPTVINGLPNIYCGMLPVMLASAFFASPGFPARERVLYLAVIIFLILSCNVNLLTFLWSGLHFTNSLPYRFSFLIPFLIVTIAYRAYISLKKPAPRDIAAMAFGAALLLLSAALGSRETKYITGSAVFAALYIALFALRSHPGANKKTAGAIIMSAIFLLTVGELAVTARINIKTETNTSDKNDFPYRYDITRRLLDTARPGPNEFYRIEFAQPQQANLNAPAVYRYDGICVFASTTNINTTAFMAGLGLPAWPYGNVFHNTETSPFTSALLNQKYMVSLTGRLAEDGFYWKAAGGNERFRFFENTRYLPLGFMASELAEDYAPDERNPFLSQNDLFRRMTGLEGDLFSFVEPAFTRHRNYDVTEKAFGEYSYKSIGDEDDGRLRWDYIMPAGGLLFGYCDFDRTGEILVVSGGKALQSINLEKDFIFTMGNFGKGDAVSLTVDANTDFGSAVIYVAFFNASLFDKGYEMLAQNTMELTVFSDTRVTGHITAEKDGLLYTSIPYEKGWRARVDGEETEIITIGGSMSALRLKAGGHEIEFTYRSYGSTAGILFSLCSLAAFSSLIFICRKAQSKRIKNEGEMLT
ncbi:MAG: YfhO family protein, partial [Oscillospiraceae bacterium]|nr:YfhO family protein [Oscillospiraceae bacterium]